MKFINNLDKKTKTYLFIGLGGVLFFIVLIIILKIAVGSKITSKVFETKVKSAAEAYYEKYPDKLPKTGSVNVTIDELVKAGTLKDPKKLLKNGVTCSGSVNVSVANEKYLYQPNITCSDNYETNLLYKKVLNDNPVTTSSDGLYKMNDYYLFRGENLNNYVKFANKNWRIVRINNDNSIRLILVDNLDTVTWDNRYNIEKKDSVGKNDFTVSRIKDTLNEYYNNNKIFSDSDKLLILPQTLCIGSRNQNATINDGSIECSKKLENEYIGLLQLNEYMLASIESTCKNITDNQCRNYNYLAKLNSYWTLTANSKDTYEVYKISGIVNSSYAYTYAQPRLVINISSNTLYNSGTGTQIDPYIVK